MAEAVLLKNSNFLLHWLGGLISQTGNFFTFIALPWLVLELTGNNPLIMSTVMAASSLPQAFFMLFGGVLADRFSPFKTLLLSRLLFVLVLFSLVYLVYHAITPLWLLYIYAFALGSLGAVATPASQAILPAMVSQSHLALANGLVMGAGQCSQILGSILAGWLIWAIKNLRDVAESQYDSVAMSMAFAVDAFGLCVAIVFMLFITLKAEAIHKENFWDMFKQGWQFCWRDKGIAFVLVYLVLISFFLYGVLISGLPVFTKVHLGLAERAYGSLYAMLGIGTVVGIGLGVLLRPSPLWLGMLVLVCDLVNGTGLFLLGSSTGFSSACVYLLLMGLCAGVVMVAGTTWFQKRTPGHLMGRVMSILMFCIMGLIPLSASLAGALMLHYPITLIMTWAGMFIFIVAFVGLLIPRVRKMGDIPALIGTSSLAPVTVLVADAV